MTTRSGQDDHDDASNNANNPPRKRPRLGSVASSRPRKHDLLRNRPLELRYNDEYRLLFNHHVAQIASRFNTNDSIKHYQNQVGASVWSTIEQATFFAALDRLGKDDVPGIARAIGTKTVTETRDFILLLQDAAIKKGNAKLRQRDIPAAFELSDECDQQLDKAAEALAWYQERLEAAQEQARYGAYWLITPAIAQDIEDHVHGRARTSTASTLQVGDTKRPGRTIAGACTSCKTRKRKCDRATPCRNCFRSQIECIYPEKKPQPSKLQKTADPISRDPADADTKSDHAEEQSVLAAIPEAGLLHPLAMLTLSDCIFMNRSPDIQSPWLHWTEYTSGLGAEPSMYRTAFNDFHKLVVSVTTRLVQTAIIQSNSRLRVQRRRSKKGVKPFVRSRDVRTAIDILGMKRNGSERWRYAPRRCGLKVYTWEKTPGGKKKRDVPWDECESIMGPAMRMNERSATETETSVEPENFKSKTARSGTPLPLQNLTLSESEGDYDPTSLDDTTDTEALEQSDHDEQRHSVRRHAFPPRDVTGRYTSIPLPSAADEPLLCSHTLEKFDQGVSRQDENALWDMLRMEPTVRKQSPEVDNDPQEADLEVNTKIVTTPDNWRESFDYRASWEIHRKPVSVNKMLANQKRSKAARNAHSTRLFGAASLYGDANNTLSMSRSKVLHSKPRTEVELKAHGTKAYAALQRHVLGDSEMEDSRSNSGTSDEDIEKDVPSQSIEAEYSSTE
ncbi:hypothetical protein GQ44DRAFT_773848 [Phaeosphaeriaceae sp. PMI808]|nr:hypothetical protein GQ44DRAFT_773848 [Phaeosphaeriaceae sp. PMI808]